MIPINTPSDAVAMVGAALTSPETRSSVMRRGRAFLVVRGDGDSPSIMLSLDLNDPIAKIKGDMIYNDLKEVIEEHAPDDAENACLLYFAGDVNDGVMPVEGDDIEINSEHEAFIEQLQRLVMEVDAKNRGIFVVGGGMGKNLLTGEMYPVDQYAEDSPIYLDHVKEMTGDLDKKKEIFEKAIEEKRDEMRFETMCAEEFSHATMAIMNSSSVEDVKTLIDDVLKGKSVDPESALGIVAPQFSAFNDLMFAQMAKPRKKSKMGLTQKEPHLIEIINLRKVEIDWMKVTLMNDFINSLLPYAPRQINAPLLGIVAWIRAISGDAEQAMIALSLAHARTMPDEDAISEYLKTIGNSFRSIAMSK